MYAVESGGDTEGGSLRRFHARGILVVSCRVCGVNRREQIHCRHKVVSENKSESKMLLSKRTSYNCSNTAEVESTRWMKPRTISPLRLERDDRTSVSYDQWGVNAACKTS